MQKFEVRVNNNKLVSFDVLRSKFIKKSMQTLPKQQEE